MNEQKEAKNQNNDIDSLINQIDALQATYNGALKEIIAFFDKYVSLLSDLTDPFSLPDAKKISKQITAVAELKKKLESYKSNLDQLIFGAQKPLDDGEEEGSGDEGEDEEPPIESTPGPAKPGNEEASVSALGSRSIPENKTLPTNKEDKNTPQIQKENNEKLEAKTTPGKAAPDIKSTLKSEVVPRNQTILENKVATPNQEDLEKKYLSVYKSAQTAVEDAINRAQYNIERLVLNKEFPDSLLKTIPLGDIEKHLKRLQHLTEVWDNFGIKNQQTREQLEFSQKMLKQWHERVEKAISEEKQTDPRKIVETLNAERLALIELYRRHLPHLKEFLANLKDPYAPLPSSLTQLVIMIDEIIAQTDTTERLEKKLSNSVQSPYYSGDIELIYLHNIFVSQTKKLRRDQQITQAANEKFGLIVEQTRFDLRGLLSRLEGAPISLALEDLKQSQEKTSHLLQIIAIIPDVKSPLENAKEINSRISSIIKIGTGLAAEGQTVFKLTEVYIGEYKQLRNEYTKAQLYFIENMGKSGQVLTIPHNRAIVALYQKIQDSALQTGYDLSSFNAFISHVGIELSSNTDKIRDLLMKKHLGLKARWEKCISSHSQSTTEISTLITELQLLLKYFKGCPDNEGYVFKSAMESMQKALSSLQAAMEKDSVGDDKSRARSTSLQQGPGQQGQPTPEDQDSELQKVIMDSMKDQKGLPTPKKQRIDDSSSHQQGSSGSGSASSSSVGSSPFILLAAPPTSQQPTQPTAQGQELQRQMEPG
jgi:hypothetical protein